MSILDDLAKVRSMQGLPPIDPSRIEGFGEGSAPAPPFEDERGIVTPADDPFVSKPVPESILASPLVALGKQPAPSKLVILDGQAAYAGQRISLSEREQAAVVRIVLLAVRRKMKEDLAALEAALPPRAKRTRRLPEVIVPAGPENLVVRPKRRYVRRKTLLKN